jgi:2-methylisocitrate lyase-like PEP mutase family enzyme
MTGGEATPGGGSRLRALLAEPGPVLAGSCYDCLSAAVLQEAGFRCLTISGAGVSASRLGLPDIGLITLTEMLQAAEAILRVASVPVIADIDTGFGNALNVVRTVSHFAAAGVAGVHLEDQVFPKRCGHVAGKSVIDTSELVLKVRAAVRARQGHDLVIVARTDALAVHGVDDAIERANRALEAGADIAFVEAPTTIAEVERIGREVEGPTLYNLVTGGKSPSLTVKELGELGFDIVVVPTVALYPAIAGMREAARQVLAEAGDEPLQRFGLRPVDVFNLVGMEGWMDLDQELAGTSGEGEGEPT